RGGTCDERLGQRGALKKAESRCGVKLDVHPGVGIRDSGFECGVESIDHALDEPCIRVALAEDAIGRAIAERDVPLVALPTLFYVLDPPASRRSPWTCIRFHLASADPTPIARHANRNPEVDTHAGWNRETETANGEPRCRRGDITETSFVLCVSESLWPVTANVVGIAGGKRFHVEHTGLP